MNDDAGAKEIPAAAPTGRDVHLALLELKAAALARRVDALRRDDLQRRLATLQRRAGQQPGQAEAVIAVHVSDEDGAQR